ncbi:MAG: hypothetical protein V3574_04260 [Candidatus Moraniibacteriota bacterium]
MSDKKSRSELSHQDKKLIEDILLKSPEKLSNQEKGILRARRSYITAVEEEVFAGVFAVEKAEEIKEEKRKPGRRKK